MPHILWHFEGLADLIADGADWGFVGPVLREMCRLTEEEG